jgi:hypothetical protein
MFSAIHLLRFAIVAAFAFTSLHAAEPNKPAPPAPVVATTVPKAALSDASEIINLRKQSDDSARDKAIAEAKLEVISAGTSRMEVVIAAFGILITLLLAAFGFATYRQAASAATKAVEEEFKTANKKIAGLLNAAEEKTGLIDQEHVKALAIGQTLQSLISAPQSSEQTPKIAEVEREELTKAAKLANETPRGERTAQDFRILMFEAAQSDNWQDYFELAEGMAYLHGKNPDDLAYALFGKAIAAHKLHDLVLAIRLSEDYLTRCPNDYPSNHAIALSNWGAALLLQAASQQGDARAALLRQAEEKLLRAERLEQGRAAYNLACLSGLRAEADKAAQWLIASKDKRVFFPDCEQIAIESDFDAVRDAAVFKAALAEIGC